MDNDGSCGKVTKGKGGREWTCGLWRGHSGKHWSTVSVDWLKVHSPQQYANIQHKIEASKREQS